MTMVKIDTNIYENIQFMIHVICKHHPIALIRELNTLKSYSYRVLQAQIHCMCIICCMV